MGLGSVIKWSAKLGIAGGAVYLVNQEHFFGNANQTKAAVHRIKTQVTDNEYYQMIPPLELPKEVSGLVSQESINLGAYQGQFRQSWNTGVIWICSQLIRAPALVNDSIRQGLELVQGGQSEPGPEQQVKEDTKKE